MNKEINKLDEHVHTLLDAGYTDIHVGNITRQSGGVDGPHDQRAYMFTVYAEKPRKEE